MPKYAGRLAAILFFLAAASCFVTAVLGSPEERATRTIIGGACAGLAGAILFFDASVGVVEEADPKIVTKEEEFPNKGNRAKRLDIDLYIKVEEKAQNE